MPIDMKFLNFDLGREEQINSAAVTAIHKAHSATVQIRRLQINPLATLAGNTNSQYFLSSTQKLLPGRFLFFFYIFAYSFFAVPFSSDIKKIPRAFYVRVDGLVFYYVPARQFGWSVGSALLHMENIPANPESNKFNPRMAMMHPLDSFVSSELTRRRSAPDDLL